MHANCQLLFQKYAREYFRPGARVLEIGPDKDPSTLRKLVPVPELEWHTLDITDAPHLTYAKASKFQYPVQDSCYDIVLAAQVMEHIDDLWRWIREIYRICKTGGHFIAIAPTSWSYHPVPIDCWRIYPDGMKVLLENVNFSILECRWESLERPGYARYLPGVSWAEQFRLWRWFSLVGGRLGLPVERAYDTIAIARKEAKP